MRVRAVFNQMDPCRAADVQKRSKVHWHAIEVDDKQGFGVAREAAANLPQVWPEVPVLDVNQHRARLEPPYSFHCGNKGIRWHNDFIIFTDVAGS